VFVRISIPSATLVTQDGTSRLLPAISTRQIRQAPTIETPSKRQRAGMKIPASWAASRTVWSALALTSCPSMVSVFTGMIADLACE